MQPASGMTSSFRGRALWHALTGLPNHGREALGRTCALPRLTRGIEQGAPQHWGNLLLSSDGGVAKVRTLSIGHPFDP